MKLQVDFTDEGLGARGARESHTKLTRDRLWSLRAPQNNGAGGFVTGCSGLSCEPAPGPGVAHVPGVAWRKDVQPTLLPVQRQEPSPTA